MSGEGGGAHAAGRAHRGVHGTLDAPLPFPVVDACVQVWDDADLAVAHRHGVACYAVTTWWPRVPFTDALAALQAWRARLDGHPTLRLALRAEHVRAAWRDGHATLLLASQDGEVLGDDPERLALLQTLGVRQLIPAYNRNNRLCGGALDVTDGGFSALGRRVVEVAARVGVVLDGSHLGPRSARQLIDLSEQPVVFSHSNPAAVMPNPRNVSDEVIRALAERGGVIGLVNWGPLVYRQGTLRRPTLSDFLDLVDHVADLLGDTRAIGLGTDFSLGSYPLHARDPWATRGYADARGEHDTVVTTWPRAPERFVAGFDDYAQLPYVIDALAGRGYDAAAIEGIMGGNLLRVYERVMRG